MSDLAPIAGRYALDAKLEAGPVATVWRGRAIGADGFERPVAVKRLHEELASNDAFVEALRAQATRLSAGVHPHVEGVVDVLRDDGGACWLVVEKVDGPSLRRWVEAHHERGAPAPYGQLLYVSAQVLYGLHALHTRREPLVHGGVGPGCIRLDRAGVPVLTRPGLRAAIDAAGIDDDWVRARGLRNAPPEGAMSPAADVFSVGLTVYTILAGASDVTVMPEELRERVTSGQPVDLSPIRDDVPPVVLRTIERALRPDPRERFESAAAMARSCELILRSLAENNDPPALAHSLAELLPPDRPASKAPPAPPRSPPKSSGPPPAPPAPKKKPPAKPSGLKAEQTDQLDLDELSSLQIRDDE